MILREGDKSKSLPSRQKVFVGLSGGVDSAVSAALLKKRGFDVTGVFIKVWEPFDELRGEPIGPCTWREERRDAMKVAIALDIPFLFFDFGDEYKKGVADKMIAEYKIGRTPNPDILCNREIKFGAFWREAKKLGADFIATGHYVSIKREIQDSKLGIRNSEFILLESADSEKDQSYFLWTLTQEDLSHTLFPVGDMKKDQVREIARKLNLPVSEKKDSQGVCFLGDLNVEDFLSRFISIEPGEVLDTRGRVIGRHDGAILYTIGERRGFEITKKSSEDGAFYIVSKDIKSNTITVSNKEAEISSLSPNKVILRDINWINEPTKPELLARIRYRGEKLPVTLSLDGKRLAVNFKKSVRGLSLGQSIVFYLPQGDGNDSDICLGGGVMDYAFS